MAKSYLSHKHLQDEEAAYAWVEAQVWPDGPVCPHCGSVERLSKMKGKATRIGLYKCYACRKQFNVKVGTIFEASHIPLRIWLQAMFLIAGSKKGISSNQLHRTFGITLKSAWFMSHRIREAMRTGSLLPPMGGPGEVVEADETFYGTKQGMAGKTHGPFHKMMVLSLVQRGGQVRSFHIEEANMQTIEPIVTANVARETAMMTDEARHYYDLDRAFASHDTVNHAKEEYVRYESGRAVITTNTVESFFALFKRGMKGTYQHCSEKHLHRYLAEFDFRHNNRVALGVNDEERATEIVKGIVGKRLTYRPTGRARSVA